ncbi:MAG TPA: hypothetical protein VHW65_06970 [Gemmatimonadales bacterium]|nr:hypothetical protein [Gemmatimonadales bacterium]
MIAYLRRRRWLAALLLLASPAVGGQAMPLLHPCTTSDTVAMGSQMAMPGMAHGSSHGTPAHEPSHHDCTCIGCCYTATVAAAPTIVTVALAAPTYRVWPVIEAAVPVVTLLDRLPEATAPPRV